MNNELLLLLAGASLLGYWYISTQSAAPVSVASSTTPASDPFFAYLNQPAPAMPTNNDLSSFGFTSFLDTAAADTVDPLAFLLPTVTTSPSTFTDFNTGLPVINDGSTGTLFNLSSAMNAGIDVNAAIQKAEQNLIAKEGNRLDVYTDNLGVVTVGIGHKVTLSDNLQVGDTITAARANSFFIADVQNAANAAVQQATDLGKKTTDFVAALISVNFQLGTGWTTKFANTYNSLKKGNIQDAISRLAQSAWYQQTPDRVNDFIASIQDAYSQSV